MFFLKYTLKRLIAVIPVWLGISLLAFLLGILAPGDPVMQMFGESGHESISQSAIEDYRQRMGLDKPILVQYVLWLNRALRGDLGKSYLTRTDIFDELAKRLPVTLQLACASLLLTLLLGVPLGLLRAYFSGKWLDSILGVILAGMLSIPGFWLAIVLINIFVERLRCLPSNGFGSPAQALLPCVVLSCGSIGLISRLTRSSVLEEMKKNYITAARSVGIGEVRLLCIDALRNSLSSVMVQVGNHFGGILGGAVVVETIFAVPGIGKYVLDAISGRDYPVVQGYVLWTGTIYILLNFFVDLIGFWLNPKMRLRIHP